MSRIPLRFAVLTLLAFVLGTVSRVRADDAGLDAGRVDADAGAASAAENPADARATIAAENAADAGATSDAAANPAVLDLDRDTREIRALTAGQLDPAIDPDRCSRSRSSTRTPFVSMPRVFALSCTTSTE